MNRIFKFFSCVFLIVASVSSYSNKAANYGDISIQADIVTLNKANNELLLEKNIIIGFGNFTIVGNKALLSYEKKKLTNIETLIKKGYKLTGELNAQSKPVVVKKNKEIFSSVKVFSSTYGFDYTTICAEIKSGLSPDKIIEKRDD